MTRFDRYVDRFICWVRDSNPIGVNPKNPQPIGNEKDPTYWRWYVWPRNPVLNCYLHRFLKDDGQDLHTHRMWNISFILQGDYFEERFLWRPRAGQPLPPTKLVPVPQRRPLIRRAWTPHRVILKKDAEGKPIPIWSLFIGFPQFWNWGFWCPSGRWVDQKIYLRTKSGSKYAYSDTDPIAGCGDD